MFGPVGVEAIEFIERSIAAEEIIVRHFSVKKKTTYDDERVCEVFLKGSSFILLCFFFLGGKGWDI